MKYSSWAFKTGLVALLIVNAVALYGHLSAVRGPGAGDLPLAILPSQVTEWFWETWNGWADEVVAETSGLPASGETAHGSLGPEAVLSPAVAFAQGLVAIDEDGGPEGGLPVLATDEFVPSPARPASAGLVFDGQGIPEAIRVVGSAAVNGSGSPARNPARQEAPPSGGSPGEAIWDVPLDGWVGTQSPNPEGDSSGGEIEQGLVALEADEGLSDESVPAVEEKAPSPETEKVTPAAPAKAAKKASQAKKAAPKVAKKAPAPAAKKAAPKVAKKAPAPAVQKAAPKVAKKAPAPQKAAPKVAKKAPAPAPQKAAPKVAKKAPAPQKTPAVKAKPNKANSESAAKKSPPAKKKPKKEPAKAEPAEAAKQQPAAAKRGAGESGNGPAPDQAKKG